MHLLPALFGICLSSLVKYSLKFLAHHEISWQEYRSGLPFPSPGDLPGPAVEPTSPALQVDSLPLSHKGSPTPITE